MREAENAASVLELGIDMMGFIEYAPSPRYAPEPPATEGVARVGVFVNEKFDTIIECAERAKFSHIQLHGKESTELCEAIKRRGYGVIKAISVATAEDLKACEQYQQSADILLFDTKCEQHGGSGKRFDWSILESYSGGLPFLLSGGIDETMAGEIKTISHPKFIGVDLNSRFEMSAAKKDIEKLRKFINKIR